MRLLTWNINGLRAILRRKYGSLKALLDDLSADIICFQETKLTKADFDRELAIVAGWDSYFSINRGRSAYSGTATFCRQGVAEPGAAQEGVTGILHKTGEGSGPEDLYETGAVDAAASVWRAYSVEELEAVDAEGRCVVTDHREFVLFNIYGPAISNEENAAERFAYKLDFYRALGRRMEALRRRGRRVVLVGDLNISPAPIDSCEPAPDFFSREDRKWLRDLLAECGGPFTDVFRSRHPGRREAYTCWQQASGARVNNWGTRIDLILAADGVDAHNGGSAEARPAFASVFADSDIWPELTGSDHCPAWTDMALSLPCEGHAAPALSTRNIFTGKAHAPPGKQNTLIAWVRQPSNSSDQHVGAASDACTQQQTMLKRRFNSGEPGLQSSKKSEIAGGAPWNGESVAKATYIVQAKPASSKAPRSSKGAVQSSLRAFVTGSNPGGRTAAHMTTTAAASNTRGDIDLERAIAASLAEQPAKGAGKAAAGEAARESLAAERETLAVASLSSGASGRDVSAGLAATASALPPMRNREPPEPDMLILDAEQDALEQQQQQDPGALPEDGANQRKQNAVAAAAAWKQIREKMKPPRCTGHNEECVIRQVKKKGPNLGRLFYVCNRADGPPPTGRCDFFVWSGNREVRGGTARASMKK